MKFMKERGANPSRYINKKTYTSNFVTLIWTGGNPEDAVVPVTRYEARSLCDRIRHELRAPNHNPRELGIRLKDWVSPYPFAKAQLVFYWPEQTATADPLLNGTSPTIKTKLLSTG